ncbi:hypothetical protein T484DRAFT_1891939 [Baffinella frigidus]|nr:hypothetical protein T484DRAFT_1891939 [Cryptophyta sp. CCMP2293]
MSRASGRVALAALRPVSTGSAWFESRAANPRGTLPPGRQDNGLRLPILIPRRLLPAQLLPWLPLGGRTCSVEAAAGTPDALVRTVVGLGARICWGGVSRGLAGSRAGGGSGILPGELTNLIKGCRDAERLLKLLEEHGHSFNFIHASAAWGRLAKMWGAGAIRVAEGEVIQRLRLLTGSTVQDMSAREVASTFHSIALLNSSGRMRADDELTGTLLARAEATAAGFIPQGVANVLWAVATMGIEPGPGLLQAMQRRATATAGDFNPQDVANVLWAVAKMEIEPEPRLLEAMQRRATATAANFEHQNVTNLLWALATMGIKPEPGLLQAMQRRATATAAGDAATGDGDGGRLQPSGRRERPVGARHDGHRAGARSASVDAATGDSDGGRLQPSGRRERPVGARHDGHRAGAMSAGGDASTGDGDGGRLQASERRERPVGARLLRHLAQPSIRAGG